MRWRWEEYLSKGDGTDDGCQPRAGWFTYNHRACAHLAVSGIPSCMVGWGHGPIVGNFAPPLFSPGAAETRWTNDDASRPCCSRVQRPSFQQKMISSAKMSYRGQSVQSRLAAPAVKSDPALVAKQTLHDDSPSGMVQKPKSGSQRVSFAVGPTRPAQYGQPRGSRRLTLHLGGLCLPSKLGQCMLSPI